MALLKKASRYGIIIRNRNCYGYHIFMEFFIFYFSITSIGSQGILIFSFQKVMTSVILLANYLHLC